MAAFIHQPPYYPDINNGNHSFVNISMGQMVDLVSECTSMWELALLKKKKKTSNKW